MADNVTADKVQFTGGPIFASDEINNVHYPISISRDTWVAIQEGLYPGASIVKKFGRGTVTTSFGPIANGAIYRTPQSGSATALRIKAGGNTNDTAAGSGAREVTLQGLDQNFNEATETIATNGANASTATTTTFTRLYRAWVSASGTYATATSGSHSAAITIENSAGTQDWATIGAPNFAKAQSEIGAYSVPSGYKAYVFPTRLVIDSGKTADVIFFHRGNIDETAPPYTAMRAKSVLTGLPGGAAIPLTGDLYAQGPFSGPCDIGFMGRVTATTGQITAEFDILLIQE